MLCISRCVAIYAVVIAFCRAITIVCLHDVSMILVGVEGAHQEEEEPLHHHVVRETSLPLEPSHMIEYFIEASLSHLQALLEQIFARGLGVESRKLEDVIRAQRFLNTLEGDTSLLNNPLASKVVSNRNLSVPDENAPSPEQASQLIRIERT
jgi:hypothetical protein